MTGNCDILWNDGTSIDWNSGEAIVWADCVPVEDAPTSGGGGKTKRKGKTRLWYETVERPSPRTKDVEKRVLNDGHVVPFKTAMEIALEGLEINVPLVDIQAQRYVEKYHREKTEREAKKAAKKQADEYELEMIAAIAAAEDY